MALLLDLADVPAEHCNSCLDDLFKAMSEPSRLVEDAAIWRPVDNPFIGGLVEDVTRRFQVILQEIQDALSRLLGGDRQVLQKADLPWERWMPERYEEARVRLESIAPSDYTLDDWLLLVDWLLQRYLGADVIRTEADYLTVRAALLGKLQASAIARAMPVDKIEDVWQFLPTRFGALPRDVLTPVETQILRVAQARTAMHIGNIAESTRSLMKGIILEHVQAGIVGQKEGTTAVLATRLFATFGALNRDFRQIAVTEVGEVTNQGFIAAQPHGARVKRFEAYRGACAFCRSLQDCVFEVVDPAAPDKNGDTQVWLGKTNIGRRASPRMRVGGMLVERPASERWWPAAGLQHPHCRGRWVSVTDSAQPGVDQAFMDDLNAKMRAKLGLTPGRAYEPDTGDDD